jgi:hypothetical protein
MSGITQKPLSDIDASQTEQAAFNDNTFSHLVDGFLSGLVGRQISQVITTTTVTGDTAVLTFSENGTQLLVLTIIYTDATQSVLLSATRTA